MEFQIILSGVGGQGLVSTGEIIGRAAALYEDNLYATMSAAYGNETRGTFTKTDVIVSDTPIGYPNVIHPNIILCLAQVAYDRYADKLESGTKLFYDTDLVKPRDIVNGEQIGMPYREMSIQMGSIQVMNTIALGNIMKKCNLLSSNSVINGIKSRFAGKEKVINLNIDALKLGLSL